jgi:hypothetical protein
LADSTLAGQDERRYYSVMFRQRRYRPDPDSYYLVETQRGVFKYHGTHAMSAFEQMCSKTQIEVGDLIRVQERRRGDDPKSTRRSGG